MSHLGHRTFHFIFKSHLIILFSFLYWYFCAVDIPNPLCNVNGTSCSIEFLYHCSFIFISCIIGYLLYCNFILSKVQPIVV